VIKRLKSDFVPKILLPFVGLSPRVHGIAESIGPNVGPVREREDIKEAGKNGAVSELS
jgi:hypothetical protein